ncbi:hypothetical protein JCM30471_13300 [Desulfuromonas carbonis]|uniref:response regulator n=1 Tax=Desulfuromonas sp. DDH964 TaxID=1823759 RepID=UPI00078DB5D6|nr:response regulator [Desulfuromonas sp. DDH964]AMV72815.1 transcriptional regulator [Desulfuromonas sp. DDH964]
MRLRIIIFEDDPLARELLLRSIEQLGHEVLAFPDPLACPLYSRDDCSCSQQYPCGDLLISDNRMPRMTGLEFIRRQAEQGCKGAAVNKALISGAWTDAQRLEAQRLGCRIFDKPLALDELLTWIGEREAGINPERQLAPLPAP